ncbi:phosphatidylserine synthase [Winogradskyella sp. PC-19]|uniref:CDP-alcohol phosphatidyltransferase family protein n=1 Tax=unclassified Winogradskyella TaxID=2615021 RepID=UPI000B3CB4F6|nr:MULTISPECIES: CDP-alcohol phosphatidyltransferase family protein [unclassified Winogradskyella]ARV08938.1 phosphatidylserine synthase [Winogradskyella sp. PC-19]RZN78734.1 MAG: phosphatidylserine synthase [Winogradskyella sp.]
MKRHIPNIVTGLNLFSGCVAILFAVQGQYVGTALFVFLGIFFDFFDGLLARKLNVQSELGLQLDSLADVVTSGVVPGIVMYGLIKDALGGDSSFVIDNTWNKTVGWVGVEITPVALIGLLITVASAYRLAKFNIDEDQQNYFKGLPTPANTLLILSLPLILHYQYSITIANLFGQLWFLIALTIISCYLLNANIKLFALKFKTWDFKPNVLRYLFLIASIILLVIFKFIAIPIIILSYILVSIFTQKSIS